LEILEFSNNGFTKVTNLSPENIDMNEIKQKPMTSEWFC